HKTAGAAVHLRGLDEVTRRRVEDGIAALVEDHAIFPTRGKQVVDLSVVPSSKAEALANLRARTGADVVVFIGDDRSDEGAMETLGDLDLGIKVGDDETHADFRLPDPNAVSVVLAAIYELR
ncbi:trehalose-phosphatase, partial [Burkholderia multivorans]